MPYGRSRNPTINRLGKFTAKAKRKRVGNTTKVKYQAPTARNQKKQIMSNAQAIRKLYSMTLPKQVYCDWQYIGQAFGEVDAGGAFTRSWAAFPLMSFGAWAKCLRQDKNVQESSTTLVERLNINMRYSLNRANYAYFNVWIVTNRKDSTQRDWPTEFAAGNNPNDPSDFIEGASGANARLNPALWKVHFASYRTLTENTLGQAAVQSAGDPFSTWAKGNVTLTPKANVRQPILGASWNNLGYMSLPYYKRYFMLVYIVSQCDAGTPVNTGAQFAFDQLATTINST